MRLLVSVQSHKEAQVAVDSGCDILDIKNPAEGSLGANFPWVLKSIIDIPNLGCDTSATIGDLPHKPGTASLAGYAVASLGIKYVKAGLYESRSHLLAEEMISAITRSVHMTNTGACFVASSFADWRKFGGLSPLDLVRATRAAGGQAILLDTFVKDGSSLFDHMSLDELSEVASKCREAGIQCALAGSLKLQHLDRLAKIGPDFIGVRGALCVDQKSRESAIDPARTTEFVRAVREVRERGAKARATSAH